MSNELINAYDKCKEISTKHYENFPVGSLLIPAGKRKYVYSIYSFARYADDIADDPDLDAAIKTEKLNELDIELNKIEHGEPAQFKKETSYIFTALSNTIEELKIDLSEFRDLLIAFRQDAVKQSYKSFNELVEYSAYSANPIGHLVLYVFGYCPDKDSECFECSDKICTALQLTNFWQDVSVDLKMGRVYLPEEAMAEHGYSYELLNRKVEDDRFRAVISELVKKTRDLFEEGNRIPELVNGRLRLELKATIAGGNEILNKIEKINYNVLSQRVKISGFDKLKLLGAVFLK